MISTNENESYCHIVDWTGFSKGHQQVQPHGKEWQRKTLWDSLSHLFRNSIAKGSHSVRSLKKNRPSGVQNKWY